MKTSRLLIATACSLAMVGAGNMAFAQTTMPTTPNSNEPKQNLNQNQGARPMQDQPPGKSGSGSMNSTTPRPTDAGTTGLDTTGRSGVSGTSGPNQSAGTRATDGSMRSDRGTTGQERAARADRN